VCKDCVSEGITTARPVTKPGPRCATHWRAERKRRSLRAHGRMVEKTYGLTEDQYWELYRIQGGCCAICRRAKGKVKRLAVDHDHETGRPRALLCGPCNQMIGYLDVDALARAIMVIADPPARKLGL
jgi:Recombination endonuclease VII